MPLLNYTTSVDAEKTIGEIQRILGSAGAAAIMLEYNKGIVVGVTFRIATERGPVSYALPCRTEAVMRVLSDQTQRKKIARRFLTQEQAARVGWRILKDWVEAQMALVQTGMVTVDEVFLPYARTRSGETVFQKFVLNSDGGTLLLEG